VYPEHLGKVFCPIYKGLYVRRKTYAKGTSLNTGIKLALNSTYGNSNDKYSPYYDPQFTMAITVNGQLTLSMMADKLMQRFGDDVRVIACNTDGLEFMVKRSLKAEMEELCAAFAKYVGIDLEGGYYKKMVLNNINNYVAIGTDNKVKSKGLYVYKTKAVGGGATDQTVGDALEWHKNHGGLVIPMAAGHELLGLGSVESFIAGHGDVFDFCLMGKVPRSSNLMMRYPDVQ
jgi:hypothetical protein